MIERAVKILYVEDDAPSAEIVRESLGQNGYSVRVCASGREFMEAISREVPDLCLVDLGLPDMSGLDLLPKLTERYRDLPVIVVSASGNVEDAVLAMKLGVIDYLTKPYDVRHLAVAVRNVLHISRGRREIDRLRNEIRRRRDNEIIGQSPEMAVVKSLIDRAASSDVPALILGETGTGKELVARAIHAGSRRAEEPFVDVNSAALTETLLESELFGHEEGAFTGAVGSRRGQFEQADGGTIFLDEIGDMPLATQAKILRVLQEKRFKRVGGSASIEVDFRVLCATNRDLESEVREKRFREDLFYRINTFVIQVPSLRDRRVDIPGLALYFLGVAAKKENVKVRGFSNGTMDLLLAYRWPGNVRELEHVVHRAVILSGGSEILPEHLPSVIAGGLRSPSVKGSLTEETEALERARILGALEKHRWVKTAAAAELGITRRILSYRMTILGISNRGQSCPPSEQ